MLTKGFVPRVTKSLVKAHQGPDDSDLSYFTRFPNSDTLLFILNSTLYISFNNGECWKSFDMKVQGGLIHIDQFHLEKGFVLTASGKLHITEDQGRSWSERLLPTEVELEDIGCYRIDTHPFDRNLLLIRGEDLSYEDPPIITYASDDNGNTFKRIDARCEFSFPSKESKLQNNGIYGIYESRNVFDKLVGTLFYTTDLGKTKVFFDELNGSSVDRIFFLSSNIAVITSDVNRPPAYNSGCRLWISKKGGGSFKLAHLPEKMKIWDVDTLPGMDERQRLLLRAIIKDDVHFLVSDSSGLNFSFWDSLPQSSYMGLEQLDNLKGTLWGRFVRNTGSPIGCEKTETFKSKECHPRRLETVEMTKGSFDNGKTWTNLKVVDPSGGHRNLFNCDIDDVEHCSFQENFRRLTFDIENIGKDPTPGIIMKTGTVGSHYRGDSERSDMTFISRDGGASWEVAFEFPVKATFLDFGNIIVAIPKENSEVYTKFFFSLDQGRTWGEYHLDEPIHRDDEFDLFDDVILDGWGLKAHLGFINMNEYTSYSVDFSNAFDGTACTENDWERWYLSNGNCIDGMRYSYDRRKPEAKCLMRKSFNKLELHEERCEC